MESINAKGYFLQILRSLCCEKWIRFLPMPVEDFQLKDISQLQGEKCCVKLKASCVGLHFFTLDPAEDLQARSFLSLCLNIDYSDLVDCTLEAGDLFIEAAIHGRLKKFQLKTREAEKIKQVVDEHSTTLDRSFALCPFKSKPSHLIDNEPQGSSPQNRIMDKPHDSSSQPECFRTFAVSSLDAASSTMNASFTEKNS